MPRTAYLALGPLLVACSAPATPAPAPVQCVTAGAAVDLTLRQAKLLLADTTTPARELRRRIGLTGLQPVPTVINDLDLCRKADRLMEGSATGPASARIVLVKLGPSYVGRREDPIWPVYYFGQRLPFGAPFEVVEVRTVPD